MSADEDTELRDLVAQTLEANGVLGKIRVMSIHFLYTYSFLNAWLSQLVILLIDTRGESMRCSLLILR